MKSSASDFFCPQYKASARIIPSFFQYPPMGSCSLYSGIPSQIRKKVSLPPVVFLFAPSLPSLYRRRSQGFTEFLHPSAAHNSIDSPPTQSKPSLPPESCLLPVRMYPSQAPRPSNSFPSSRPTEDLILPPPNPLQRFPLTSARSSPFLLDTHSHFINHKVVSTAPPTLRMHLLEE